MSRTWPFAFVIFLLVIVSSCSGGRSPVMPGSPGSEPGLTGAADQTGRIESNHFLWGFWHIIVDPQTMTAEVVPLRGTSFHLNAARILDSNPVGISYKVNSLDIPSRLLDFDVTITHPVPGSDLRGFDVRGILMGPGDTIASETDPALVYNAPDGTRLLNPDGYTRWWNAVEFTSAGYFGYDTSRIIPGFLIPATTLNPYKYFADPLGPHYPVIPGVNESNRGTFSTDGTPPSLTRNYLVQFPLIDGKPKLAFHYAIDASWAPPTGGSSPPKPIEAFPPQANCPEAYYIEVNTEGIWAYYESDDNRGGDVVLQIEVYDWQAPQHPDGILGEIAGIVIESPTLFSPYYVQPLEVTPGTSPCSGIFEVTIPDVQPTDVDDQEILVTVKSKSPNSYSPPFGNSDYPGSAALAAYAIVLVPVYSSKPPGFGSFVEIESPNGGEFLLAGTSSLVQWEASETIENVAILLSLDSGETFLETLAMPAQNDGEYEWENISGEYIGARCRLEIFDVDDPSIIDSSDADFTILPAPDEPITVLSPDGGEEFDASKPAVITWGAIGSIENVSIWLSTDSGQNYEWEIVTTTPNDGYFLVEAIPDDAVSDACRIRVSDAEAPEIQDESDGNFSIRPSLTLDSPGGGEYWIEGNAYEITWRGSPDIESVMLLLSSDSGENYMAPITMSTPNDGSYTWYIDPSVTESNHCRVKVLDVLPTMIEDESVNDFTIFPESAAPLNVISPNGGETWIVGTPREITWIGIPSIDEVTIDLSTDGCETWAIQIVEGTANDGSFIWDPVPDTVISEFCRVRIAATGNPIIYDISNESFAIEPEGDPFIQIESPADGEVWQIGMSQTTQWQWGGNIPCVDVFLMIDNVGTYTIVADDLLNIGYHNIYSFEPDGIDNLSIWDSTELTGRIRVEHAGNPGIFDEAEIAIPINLGILYEMVSESVSGDTDADRIPDDVEVFLGTDPGNNDSDIPDPDAFFDNFEIFGQGYFNSFDLIPDVDCDGIIAPLDPDDDGDGINDGEATDSDNDGIANYLEYYGYTYNWMSGTYDNWDRISIDEPYYKTDPLQPSTDQDPYPDGMEASGLLMDVSVQEPGAYPMVPAYPNIVVVLEGYDVTLNQEITYEEGESLEEGLEWSSQTEIGWSRADEWHVFVNVGGEIGYTSSSFHCIGHLYFDTGFQQTETNSIVNTFSKGGSVISGSSWSRATSMNPTDVAHLKLYLKVYNLGTSCASNIKPTLTLKIGQRNIATFEPQGSLINLLGPGGVYPEGDNNYWVVTHYSAEYGVLPISLTLDELRALECGAPVSIVMTQMQADVMLMNQSGQWESAGDWNEYMTRCEAACSNLYMELGEGNWQHYLVYSDNADSAPMVTLGDAMVWAFGAAADDSDIWVTYRDRETGQEVNQSLDEFDFVFDTQTYIANGFSLSPFEPPCPDYNIFDMVLGPDSAMVAKLPRESAVGADGPAIIYASLDEKLDTVDVLAIDYNGIDTVLYYDKDGFEYEMQEELEGTGVFSLSIPGTYVSHFTDGNGMEEKVIAYSGDSSAPTAEATVEKVQYEIEPTPVPPSLDYVQLDSGERTLIVDVTTHPDYPLTSIEAYHPPINWGPEEMDKNPFWWIWPNRYEILSLPEEITLFNQTDTVIIAYATGCDPVIHQVTENECAEGFAGSADLTAWYEFGHTDCPCNIPPLYWMREKWGTVRMNIDCDDAQPVQLMRDTGCYLIYPGWNSNWNSYHWNANDFWIRYYSEYTEGSIFGNKNGWLLFFNYDYCLYDGDKEFEELTKQDCQACSLIDVPPLPFSTEDYEPIAIYYDGSQFYHTDGDTLALSELPAIFIMKTSSGNWAKIKLEYPTTFMDPNCPFSKFLEYGFNCDIEYLVFP